MRDVPEIACSPIFRSLEVIKLRYMLFYFYFCKIIGDGCDPTRILFNNRVVRYHYA
jgi:hypothetical protein